MNALHVGVAAALAASSAFAQSGTFAVKQLTPETALKAAQAALATCRKNGHQVTVAVVDRAGLTQALLRDRFAGPHTLEVAVNKAWTAVTFKTPTTELEKLSRPGQPMSGLRSVPRMTPLGGGMVIEAGGTMLGGIGVSGAPGGDADDACAAAGIKAIAEEIEF